MHIIEQIKCDKNFSVKEAPRHNRSDGEIHYWVVHFASKDVYEFHDNIYDNKYGDKLKAWYLCKSEDSVFDKLREASVAREKLWNPPGTEIHVGFHFTQFAGEAGEVANAGKKLMRHDMGMVGGTDDITNLKEEIGDAVISLELVARHYKIDLWDAIVDKFNKTSDKHGFPVKLQK